MGNLLEGSYEFYELLLGKKVNVITKNEVIQNALIIGVREIFDVNGRHRIVVEYYSYPFETSFFSDEVKHVEIVKERETKLKGEIK